MAEDLSAERRVDWDKEIEAGHLTRVDPTGKRGAFHLRGKDISKEEAELRMTTSSVMAHVRDTGRYPDGYDPRTKTINTGRASFGPPRGGWPQFEKRGPM